ncbi:MAG: aldolase/citrate lyase family protein [Anderseniella sp.]
MEAETLAPLHPLSLKSWLGKDEARPVLMSWCQFSGPGQAAVMVRAGFAGVLADMQHGNLGYEDMRDMVAAVAHAGGVAMMRPPLDDFGMVARALDAGASVIIAPMINTGDDARRLVDVSKYPPLASRSFGPAIAMDLWGMDAQAYLSAANELTTVLAMIETAQAITNLDEILGVDGIDGVFVGPYDLSINLSGGMVAGANDPDVVDALPMIVASAKKHGKIAGIYASGPEQVKIFTDLGFDLISASSDAGLITAGVKSVLDAL